MVNEGNVMWGVAFSLKESGCALLLSLPDEIIGAPTTILELELI